METITEKQKNKKCSYWQNFCIEYVSSQLLKEFFKFIALLWFNQLALSDSDANVSLTGLENIVRLQTLVEATLEASFPQ